MPDPTDSDAKILALRMYYLELSDGVSSIQAQGKVSIAQLQVIHTQSKDLCIGVSRIRHEFRQGIQLFCGCIFYSQLALFFSLPAGVQ